MELPGKLLKAVFNYNGYFVAELSTSGSYLLSTMHLAQQNCRLVANDPYKDGFGNRAVSHGDLSL